ncbi:unnamed protein product [Dibothriocephalus latus]|uniref:BPTI/Kunitz inhibitor domain-containing protein n=1 Tax=Dibothriocephalus latus TaxID=60516 RepID=A0A3P6QR39_DIBLA|nr:unnamed protein product [Dibothriocephalus latus]
MPQYGYDADIGACRQFIYHGCDGNANRFGTFTECEAATATCSNKCM